MPDVEDDLTESEREEARLYDEVLRGSKAAREDQEANRAAGAPALGGEKKKPPEARVVRRELLLNVDDEGNVAGVARALVMSDGARDLEEPWRPPTAAELHRLQTEGKWLRGGPVGDAEVTETAEKKSNTWKWVLGGVAVLAAAGGAYIYLGDGDDGSDDEDDD